MFIWHEFLAGANLKTPKIIFHYFTMAHCCKFYSNCCQLEFVGNHCTAYVFTKRDMMASHARIFLMQSHVHSRYRHPDAIWRMDLAIMCCFRWCCLLLLPLACRGKLSTTENIKTPISMYVLLRICVHILFMDALTCVCGSYVRPR